MASYVRNPQTEPDDSPGGSTVRQAVADQNNVAIDDLYTNLNSHSNNEDGRSHAEIDESLNYIETNFFPVVEEAVQEAVDAAEAAENAEAAAKVNADNAADCAAYSSGLFDSLGTAAFKDVTTSTTDTTADRLTKVGDFGLGGVCLFVSSANALDNINYTTFVQCSTANVGLVNGPPGASGGVCLNMYYSPTNKVQNYQTVAGTKEFWTRQYNGFWSSWVKVLTTEDVTTSTTDTTAGRLLKVGDFGLGVLTFQVVDINTLVIPGFYAVNSTSPNLPVVFASHIHVMASSIQVKQVCYTYQGEVYERQSFNDVGVFGSWKKSYSSNNVVGTVSQSGGVPTGAIIERGSNANGEYAKLADGTVLVSNNNFTSQMVNQATGNIWQSPTSETWTFPASSVVNMVVSGSVNSAIRWLSPAGAGGNSCAIRQFSSVTAGTLLNSQLFGVGRWF